MIKKETIDAIFEAARVEEVIGGFGKIKETNLPIVTQECESSCSTK